MNSCGSCSPDVSLIDIFGAFPLVHTHSCTHTHSVPPWSRCSVFNGGSKIFGSMGHTHTSLTLLLNQMLAKHTSCTQGGARTHTHTHTHVTQTHTMSHCHLALRVSHAWVCVCQAPERQGGDSERWNRSVCLCVCVCVFVHVCEAAGDCVGLAFTELTTLHGHDVPLPVSFSPFGRIQLVAAAKKLLCFCQSVECDSEWI